MPDPDKKCDSPDLSKITFELAYYQRIAEESRPYYEVDKINEALAKMEEGVSPSEEKTPLEVHVYEGLGSQNPEKDLEKATSYIEKMAEQSNEDAQKLLQEKYHQ